MTIEVKRFNREAGAVGYRQIEVGDIKEVWKADGKKTEVELADGTVYLTELSVDQVRELMADEK